MTKPLYLGMSILDSSKILMYEFWYDYINLKYGGRAKFCYKILIVLLFTLKQKIFQKIFLVMLRWFDTSNYDKKDKKPLPTGKNKKVPGLFEDELGGKIITEFVTLIAKAYSCLDDDDDNEHKKSKGTKKCVIKQKLMFQNFKDFLLNN